MSSPVLKTALGDRLSMGHTVMNRSDAVTRDSVITATLAALSVCVLCGVGTIMLGLKVSPELATMANYVGCGGTLLMFLVLSFSPSMRRKAKIPTFILAVFQGLMLGGFTFSIGSYDIQGVPGWNLVGQALVGTVALFFVALFLYYSGAIRVTSGFTKFIMFSVTSFGILYAANFAWAIFSGKNLLMSDGPIPIIIGVVAIILGTLTLIQDFDTIDNMVEAGSPKETQWALAAGLVSSLVWLYMEILRVLFLIARQR